MRDERYIIFIDHIFTINNEKSFSKSKIHFKKPEAIEFAKNICEFLLMQDWYSADNSGNIFLRNEKGSPVFGVNSKMFLWRYKLDYFLYSEHKPVEKYPFFELPQI